MHVIYFSDCLARQTSGRISNIAKQANFGNKGATVVKFSPFDGRDESKHSGVGLVDTLNYLRHRMIFPWQFSSYQPSVHGKLIV